MVTDSAKKALEAGAINTRAQSRWINEQENCILPQFTNVVAKEGSLLSLEHTRKLLVDKEVRIEFQSGTTTVVFDYAADESVVEIEDKKGKKRKITNFNPVGHTRTPFTDPAVLNVLAESMLPAEWKQLVYLTFGIGYYTKLEYQGPGYDVSVHHLDAFKKEEKEKPPSTPRS